VNSDARGWRMALVPDALMNPPDRAGAALPDVLGVLEASGYGVLHLPPPGEHSLLLAVIADQCRGVCAPRLCGGGDRDARAAERRAPLAPPCSPAATQGRGATAPPPDPPGG